MISSPPDVQNPGCPESNDSGHGLSEKPLILYFSFSFYTFFILFLYFFILFYTFPMVFQWLCRKSIKTLSKSINRCPKSIKTLSKSIKTWFWALRDGPESKDFGPSGFWTVLEGPKVQNPRSQAPGPVGSSLLSKNCI